MKILGIDYGSKYLGIAISDSEQRQSFVYDTLEAADGVEGLGGVIHQEQISALVLGLPLSMDGTEGPVAARVREFAQQLESNFNLPVYFEDERLTTKMVEGFTKQKGAGIDDHTLAAQEILQSYLDKHQKD